MANIVWEMPAYSNNLISLKTCVADLNQKLIELGLIDYLNQNTDNINNTSTTTFNVPGFDAVKAFEIAYKLPTGNGKTIFEDVPSTNYKKIINESYDSTEVYIKIIFYINNLYPSTVSHSETNSNYFHYTSIVYVSGNSNFTNYNIIDNTTYNNDPGKYSASFIQGTRLCIINLTGNNFSILWNDRNIAKAVDSSGDIFYGNMSSQPFLFFSIYRENNTIICNSRNYIGNNTYVSNNQSSTYGQYAQAFHILTLYEIQVRDGQNISFTQKNQVEYMRRIPENAPYISEQNATIYPVYMDLMNNMRINPAICRIYVDSAPTPIYNTQVSLYDVVTYYKGQKVKFKYYNVSLIYHRLKTRKDLATNINGINNKDCSYLLLLEDYPVTTDPL